MRLVMRTVAGAALVAVTATTLGVAGAGVAAAAGNVGNGSMSVSPTSGVANNATTGRPTFTTNGACPTGTANVNATMTGPGWPTSPPVTALGTTNTIAFSNASGFSFQLSDTFAGIASANSQTIQAGTYTITLQCLDQFGTSQATATAPITFGSGNLSAPWHTVQATTTTVSSSPASPQAGDAVTLTATVTNGAVGTVSFTWPGQTGTAPSASVAGAATPNTASVTTTGLPTGTTTVTASFSPTDSTTWSASSGTTNVTVGKVTPTVSTSISPAAPYYSTTPLSFNCTVAQPASGSGSSAGTPSGTVTFTYTSTPTGGAAATSTTAAITLSGGSASYSAGSFAAGTVSVYCTYTPATGSNFNTANNSASPSTATISSVDPNKVATEYIQTTVSAGALTLTVQGLSPGSTLNSSNNPQKVGTPVNSPATYPYTVPSTGGTNVVILPNANVNAAGTYIVTTGNIIPVEAVDTRAGDPGYHVTGQMSTLTGQSNSANKINAADWGWTPQFISYSRFPSATTATAAGLTDGGTVAPGPGYLSTATPTSGADGLSTAKTLYTAPANNGSGTVYYGASLSMQAPTSTQPDTYVGVLTLTAS